jgi:hypothetical protein
MIPLLLTIVLANPITRVYDVSDLISPPPQFTNAPNFSISVGIYGSFPIVVTNEKVIRMSNRKKLENMVYEIAENMDEYDATVRWWGDNMIVTGSRKLHRRVQ